MNWEVDIYNYVYAKFLKLRSESMQDKINRLQEKTRFIADLCVEWLKMELNNKKAIKLLHFEFVDNTSIQIHEDYYIYTHYNQMKNEKYDKILHAFNDLKNLELLELADD